MNRLIQTARIAHEMGNTEAVTKIVSTVKERLENWLSYSPGEVAFLFHYSTTWSTILGYPAGHGQDSNINDHHFHWGYFIHAASFLEQFEPGWAENWGEMVNILIRDAAGTDRNDPLFPYLRNFSPYAGHCWANGFASFPQGNDQESTSESMQFNSSLIHWGAVTGNKDIRDLGIYLYTTEQTAIEEYWFDIHERNFKPTQEYSLVSRVWGNSYDNGTFWTNDIAASYGIELYPIHGGSLYLGHNQTYISKLWNEIKANTGITSNEANDNLWHDVMYKFSAFIDPASAIQMYDSYPDRNLKFGTSDAQTYYWLHAMNALGQVDVNITANYPIAAAFTSGGETTYVAHNYTNSPITVSFSTGYELDVPANSMKTSKDIDVSAELTSSFNKAYTNGSVELNLNVTKGTPTKIEFLNGSTVIGAVTTQPFKWTATELPAGKHNFYARIYVGEQYNTSNSVPVTVGSQLPFNGTAWTIPGTIEAAKYDIFEGGNGQNVTYMDVSLNNEGDFRTSEYVDASIVQGEGATVGWISAGEWLEYTIDVAQSGNYSMDFRYASGNSAGGGPFHLEINEKNISGNISVPSTSSTNWDVWKTKTAVNIPLTKGEHALRVKFSSGEFNLGKMTFKRTGDIPFSIPTANAGETKKVILPSTSTTLDGSASSESTNQPLNYEWSQVFGPSVVQFSNKNSATPNVTGLVEGIYRMQLMVTNSDMRSDIDEMMIIVTSNENLAPIISITSPSNNSSFKVGEPITISANASDIDGTIQSVDFYQNEVLIESVATAPFTIEWSSTAGNYDLTAKATDNDGATSTSQPVAISINAIEACSGTSDEASQGSFEVGYNYTFETVGTTVSVTFEMLDQKEGVVAFLWNKDPFSEKEMTHVEGKRFTTTLTGKPVGSTIEVACKFAFAGGMSVTKYLTYEVGDNCGGEADNEAPTSFTASKGDVTSNSVELILSANDNSGTVSYYISYGTTKVSTNAASGAEKRYKVVGLSPSTDYSFSIVAKDASGNTASNSPLIVEAKTLESSSSKLKMIDFETVGHNWSWTLFENGDNAPELYEVTSNPNPSGINASSHVAKYSVNAEGALWAGLWSNNIGEFTFTSENCIVKAMVYKDVITDFALKFENSDASIELEIKAPNTKTNEWEELTFDFSEYIGKTVSKLVIIPDFPTARTSGSVNYWDNISFNSSYATYISNTKSDEAIKLFPNPVKNQLTVTSSDEINTIIIRDLSGAKIDFKQINDTEKTLDLGGFSSGIYFITVIHQNGNIETDKIIKL